MNLRPIRRIEKAVKNLQAMGLDYNWGGARVSGHIAPPSGPGRGWTDCSGFGLYLKQVGGLDSREGAGSTFSMAEEGHEGVSPYLTFYIKNAPADDAHVIVRLRRRPRPWHRGEPRFRWCECGGSDNPRPGGGPAFFKPTPARVAEFPIHRHFPEFDKKVAGH